MHLQVPGLRATRDQSASIATGTCFVVCGRMRLLRRIVASGGALAGEIGVNSLTVACVFSFQCAGSEL